MAADWNLSAEGAQRFADRYTTYLADPSLDRTRKGEKQLSQRFWQDFFSMVCGVSDSLGAGIEFEYPVRLPKDDTVGWIDVLWPAVLLIEHKSAGHSLDKAEEQARDYLQGLEPKHRPPVVIVSDFHRFRVIEVLAARTHEFALAEVPLNLNRFEAIFALGGVGAAVKSARADARAAELMSDLYLAFEAAGYGGHEVSVFLVRCLFLLFGDDTRLWRQAGEHGLFGSIVESSPEDGSGLGGQIQELFQALNQKREERPGSLNAVVAQFPYVNGGLFGDDLRVFSFSRDMRKALLAACDYDWSDISPAIFGAMFQNIKSQELRRELGEHYTSETNIMKVITPLFLEELNTRLDKAWDSPTRLRRLQDDLATYTWLDPACGCGNFLLVAYKRMRELELRIAVRLLDLSGKNARAFVTEFRTSLRLSQFHGIELNEWSSQIASVAMLLAEHQANMEMERVLGLAPDLLPLSDAAVITQGNALETDWSTGFVINDRTFIMGNPPFGGYHLQSDEQRHDTALLWGGVKGQGVVDYVANWFLLGARYAAATGAHVALVATNSISQGEQPPIIWRELGKLGIVIDFAHRTFKWSNGTNHQAAVHTIIVGFSKGPRAGKRSLWTYSDPVAEPERTDVANINAYLLDAADVLVTSRRTPLVPWVPPLRYGSKPTDGGFLSNISRSDADAMHRSDKTAAKYLRKLVGAEELINGGDRWCLWLVGAPPSDLRSSPELNRRVRAVTQMRADSKKSKTREDAARGWEFQEVRQPTSPYLALSQHSSEGRDFLPLSFFGSDVVTNNSVSIIEDAPLVMFGMLASHIFWVWAGAVSGRLESRIRISSEITYNNFPFPDLSEKQSNAIERAAQGVLDARAAFPDATLADLYDPETMPTSLRSAHEALEREIEKALGIPSDASDETILDRLFDRYSQLIAVGELFPTASPTRRRRRSS